MKDYYKSLGLKKDASADDIKRAYRKLAHEHHPDKGGNPEQFKEINEAYQTLSDPNKKAQYDQFGSAGGGFGGQGGYEDIFRGGFGGGFQGGGGGFGNLNDILENFFGQAFSQVQIELQVSLTQALLGGEIKFKTPAGEEVELKLPPATQNGQAFKFKGKGNAHRGGRGDLIVVVRIDYPKRLTKEQKELIKKLQETGL